MAICHARHFQAVGPLAHLADRLELVVVAHAEHVRLLEWFPGGPGGYRGVKMLGLPWGNHEYRWQNDH
jgi:hypothetical protein